MLKLILKGVSTCQMEKRVRLSWAKEDVEHDQNFL